MNLWELPKTGFSCNLTLMEKLDINKLIGVNIRRLREKNNLSQGEFAELIGTVPTRISAIENGREPMGKDYTERICRALNIEPWEFYVTEKTPIIKDEQEVGVIYRYREEKAAGVSEQVAKYGQFMVAEAKKSNKVVADKKSHPVPIDFTPRMRDALRLFERAEKEGKLQEITELANRLISGAKRLG